MPWNKRLKINQGDPLILLYSFKPFKGRKCLISFCFYLKKISTGWARVRYLVGASTVSGPVHTNYHLVGICSFFMNVTFSPPPAFGEKAISQEISLKLFIWRLNSLSAPS